jgi:DNA polymerase
MPDAATLPDLDTALAGFAHPLRRSDVAPQLVVGNADARIIILCDQIEDADSPAALLRTRMLAAIGLDPGNSALLHRIPWPMPGGRSPNAGELAAFAPFADRALAIVRPRAVLALGQLAAGIAGDAMARNSARGRWADLGVGDAVVPLLASCHPRLLLNQPLRKREAWADLQAFAARLAVTA